MVTPLLDKDPADPGRVKQAIAVSNRGSHDDPGLASRQELKAVMDGLLVLRNVYCR